jgi:WD40 repeat protein
LQLRVDQVLKNYSGYSGSPVLHADKVPVVVGIMVEQLPERNRPAPGEARQASNVLYATPIEDIIARFEIADVIRTATPKDIEPVYYNVPELPYNLLERPQYFEALKSSLIEAEEPHIGITGVPHHHGLFGMGGIGKTILAAMLACDADILTTFPQIIWLSIGRDDADNPVDIVAKQRECISALKVPLPDFTTWQQGRSALSQITRDCRCLIVLDDVWQPQHAEAFTRLGPQCRLLVTTRIKNVLTKIGATDHCIKTLSRDDALSLMAKTLHKPIANEALAEAVAQECGYLPLALAMVSALIKDRRYSWQELLARLRNADIKRIKAELPEYEHEGLLSALEISVAELNEQQQSAYFALAVFPEDVRIPTAALKTLWSTVYNDPEDAKDFAHTLVHRALMDMTTDVHFRLHDLYFDYLRAKAKQTNLLQEYHNQILQAYQHQCGNEWAAGPGDPEDDYYFHYLAYHLIRAGKDESLRALLLNYDWLYAKLRATNIAAVLADYAYFPNDTPLQLIAHALRLSQHVLSQEANKSQLAGQLLARLRDFEHAEIHTLLQGAEKGPGVFWLKPRTMSLTPPGGALRQTLTGHTSSVLALALSADGQRVISGSYDNTLKIWDVANGDCLHTLKGHTDSVRALVLSADGKRVISGSSDNTIKIWDVASGDCLHTLKGHTDSVRALVLSGDGQLMISGSSDNTIKIWDMASGECLHTLQGHTDWVNALLLSADSQRVISGSRDHTLKIWDVTSGKCLHTLQGHTGPVNTLALSADGQQVISGSLDHTIKIWDVASGDCLRTLQDHTDGVEALAFSGDGQQVISGSYDNTIKIWDVASGKCLHTLQGHTGPVNTLSLSADDQRVISGSWDETLKIWDVASGECLHTLQGHTRSVYALTLSTDGQQVISGSEDHTLKIWDVASGNKCLRTLQGHTGPVNTLALSADGQQAISGSYDHTIKIWDVASGDCLRTLQGHTDGVEALALSGDGRRVISGSLDHTIKIWDVASGDCLHTLQGHTGYINALALSTDGQRVISGSDDRTLKIWDVASGDCVHTLIGHSDWVNTLALSIAGQRVISGSQDHTLKIWDVASGDCLQTLQGHTEPVFYLALSANGQRVISHSGDHTLKIWDVASGDCLQTLQGHTAPVIALVLSADSQWVISGSFDHTLKIWDVANGDCLHTLKGHTESVNALALSTDGQRVISGSDDHTLKIWDLTTYELLTELTFDAPITTIVTSGNNVIAGDGSGAMHFLQWMAE